MATLETFLTSPLGPRGVFPSASGVIGVFALAAARGVDGVASIVQAVPLTKTGAELTRERSPRSRLMADAVLGIPNAFPELLTLAGSLKKPPDGANIVAPLLSVGLGGLPGTLGDLGVGPTEQEGRKASRID